jgi:hypothetical protein
MWIRGLEQNSNLFSDLQSVRNRGKTWTQYRSVPLFVMSRTAITSRSNLWLSSTSMSDKSSLPQITFIFPFCAFPQNLSFQFVFLAVLLTTSSVWFICYSVLSEKIYTFMLNFSPSKGKSIFLVLSFVLRTGHICKGLRLPSLKVLPWVTLLSTKNIFPTLVFELWNS